jgi:hypothetical protein
MSITVQTLRGSISGRKLTDFVLSLNPMHTMKPGLVFPLLRLRLWTFMVQGLLLLFFSYTP